MINERTLDLARLHVRRWFARRMPKYLLFHDLDHTLAVTRSAVAIGQAMKLGDGDLRTLEVAALFHDTGYALVYAGHEEKSAQLATAFLGKHGVASRTIAHVRSLILATRMGVVPRTLAQNVLRDADSAKAGQMDFEERSERLRKELEVQRKRKLGNDEWLKENLAYLEAHRFHTAHARRRYGLQKRINLNVLRQRAALPKRKRPARSPAIERFFERDLSWLSFNDRVLQEAKDPRVPLLERLKFLAIYSSNLDEFYRVRVASLRSLVKLKRTDRTALDIPAEKLVDRINRKALKQQQEFGALYRGTLLPALARHGIRILREDQLDKAQLEHLRVFFTDRIAPLLNTAAVRPGNAPFIEDRKLYFACRLRPKGKSRQRLVLLNIPSDELGRFIALPSRAGRSDVIFLDDVMRVHLASLFTGYKVMGCHAIKLSRDAELYLDEEFVGNVKEKVRKSLRKRQTGTPSRFLYDSAMPHATLRALRTLLGLSKQDMVAGGRYHNFSDLMKLPVKRHAALRDKPWPPRPHPRSARVKNTFAAVAKGDMLWHYPYHDFGMFTRWLQQAAADKAVKRIAITLYRVAESSEVCTALLDALGRGKQVTVFVEVQARFDERSNLFWGEALEKAGAQVLYSYEGLKVHCKLCLIERVEKARTRRYAYLATGNFNERTAPLYSDQALLTCNEAITREVAEVFAHLRDRRHRPRLQHLLMAPLTLRDQLEAFMDKEIEHALSGRPASILLKLNSLEDRAMISKLYDASRAGVKVRLIIRGICCLVPGIPGTSDNIEAISIVDRFLEHSRAYVFHNNGKPLLFLSSADLMGRNLDHRIEVAFPLLDPMIQKEMIELLEIQWKDRVKARLIDAAQTNPYRKRIRNARPLRAQEATYAYIKKKKAAIR
ncbi:MAG: polyphosphate kinase 1 [Flavobacteriales bacterium]